ncbi:hypothetical protein DSC45_34145 [Streptomyces sp. YIM 130001]|uniref:hypothetical protein n=1 Tax=Streptomyces sp. YIM 130001 TaxID=2259644 RepID=UPI000E65637B|nr:hypothetical protein [Streptomyces sp. YIM 130001]RII07958.1 hypothetical protein DSC45_34145 [Streptomyces sp. YIM 130001]
MPVTALVSAKSCGVTTSALALTLASKRPSLLAECDPAGGTVRAGFLEGQVGAGFGLYYLAAAERTGHDALANAFAHHLWSMDLEGQRKLLPGLTDPAQAGALSRTWPVLSDVLHVLADEAGYDIYVDAGRIALEEGRLHGTLTPAAVVQQADLVLLVVRGTEQSLTLARHVIDPLRTELAERGSGADALGLLLIGDGPHRAHQVTEALKAPVLASLPGDEAAASYFASGGRPPRGFTRGALMRSARTATEQVEAFTARRQVQQQYPPRPTTPYLAGFLNQLSKKGGARG